MAPDKEGKWKVFVRVKDQNLVASKILLQLWKHQKNKTEVKIRYREQEEVLMHFLTENGQITMSQFCRIAGIPAFMAEKILLNFILLDIIKMEITEKQTYYRLIDYKV